MTVDRRTSMKCCPFTLAKKNVVTCLGQYCACWDDESKACCYVSLTRQMAKILEQVRTCIYTKEVGKK